MKLLSKYILGFALVIGAQSIMADEVKKADASVHITIVKINPVVNVRAANVKISPSDYPKGVYVIATEVFGERPKSAGLFANKLRQAGFKITETKESADLILNIGSTTMNFKEIEESASSVISNNGDRVAGLIGGAVLTGGLSLLVSDYSFLDKTKPFYADMIVHIGQGKEDKDFTMVNATLKTDAKNYQTTQACFEVMIDAWVKAYVLSEVSNSNVVSGVAAASSITATAVLTNNQAVSSVSATK
jgi:hypothetical protein